MIRQKKLSRIEELAAEARTFVALGDNSLDPADYVVEDGELALGYGRKVIAQAGRPPVLLAHGKAVRVIGADETGADLLAAAIEDGERENDAHADACEAAILEEVPDPEPVPEVDADVLRLAEVVEQKLDVLRAARSKLAEAEDEVFTRDVENVRAALATVLAGRVLVPGRRFGPDDHLRPLRVAVGEATGNLRGALAILAIATRS